MNNIRFELISDSFQYFIKVPLKTVFVILNTIPYSDFSVNVSQSTLAKQDARLAMPVGSCIALSMESSRMDRCQAIKPLVRLQAQNTRVATNL